MLEKKRLFTQSLITGILVIATSVPALSQGRSAALEEVIVTAPECVKTTI